MICYIDNYYDHDNCNGVDQGDIMRNTMHNDHQKNHGDNDKQYDYDT